jgi:hypothetical protein
VLVGFAELRLGTRRTALVTAATQLAGVLGAAAVLRIAAGVRDLISIAHPTRQLVRA